MCSTNVSPLIDEIYEKCRTNAPNYGVEEGRFRASLERITRKFIATGGPETVTADEVSEFLSQIPGRRPVSGDRLLRRQRTGVVGI